MITGAWLHVVQQLAGPDPGKARDSVDRNLTWRLRASRQAIKGASRAFWVRIRIVRGSLAVSPYPER